MNESNTMQRDEPSLEKPFQFSLRALLVLTAVVAVSVAANRLWGLAIALLIVWLAVLALLLRKRRFDLVAPFVTLSLVSCCLFSLLAPAVTPRREPSRRTACVNNLKNIGLAVLSYEAAHGSMPPAYTVDENGRRMHSWRTLILPYLERNNLYQSFDLNQPWNGPNNSKLAIDLGVFTCPSDPSNHKAQCNYVAVVGPGTLWPDENTTSLAEVARQDGLSSTIMLVEVIDCNIAWNEPRDLDIRTMVKTINARKGLGIGSRHLGGVNVVFADGRCRFLSEDVLAETLEAMLTVDGGEVIDDKDF